MTHYDPETDTLTVSLAPRKREVIEYQGADVVAAVSPSGELVEVRIAHATQFLARAREAGVPMPDEGVRSAPEDRTIWVQADSTMLSAFGYDPDARALVVVFRRGGTYRYYDVPPSVFEGLRNAPSKGRYMHAHIIGVYPWVRLTRSPLPLGER